MNTQNSNQFLSKSCFHDCIKLLRLVFAAAYENPGDVCVFQKVNVLVKKLRVSNFLQDAVV